MIPANITLAETPSYQGMQASNAILSQYTAGAAAIFFILLIVYVWWCSK